MRLLPSVRFLILALPSLVPMRAQTGNIAGMVTDSSGAGALVYLIAWAVLPEEGEKSSIVENYLNKKKSS